MAEVDDIGTWETITALAERRGVSKGAMSRMVKRFETLGLLSSKPGDDRRVKLVNVAEFDRAASDATDAVRELNGSARASGSLAEAQTRRASYDADLKRLQLEERLGKLIPIEDAQDSMVKCAEGLVRVIDQVSARAEELAAAVAKDGEAGALTYLKGFARDLRELLARSMKLLADDDEEE
jgi:DNA-binding MarR family transcriptional regulator